MPNPDLELVDQFLETLHQRGFNVDRRGPDRYYTDKVTAAHRELGISIKFNLSKHGDAYQLEGMVSKRTARGGYKPIHNLYLSILRQGIAFTLFEPGAPLIDRAVRADRKSKLYEPRQFSAPLLTYPLEDTKYTEINLTVRAARVADLVEVVNDKCIPVTGQPDQNCWFLMACLSLQGATFNLLFNDQGWLPVNRRSMKVTNNLSPKASVDMAKLNKLDRLVLRDAIARYLGGRRSAR